MAKCSRSLSALRARNSNHGIRLHNAKRHQRARVQGTFRVDATRVRSAHIRRLGRFGTWVAREAESGESEVSVMLPAYDNVILGTAVIPGIKVNIQDGHGTAVDFLTDLAPGNMDGARKIASDWIDGRLEELRIIGEAKIPLMSGLLSFGTQTIQQEVVFANSDIPDIPAYEVKKINFREAETSTGKEMLAEVSLLVKNDYPVEFTIPPLTFLILVDNCEKNDPYIKLADAVTAPISVHAKEDMFANVTGLVRELPPVLTQDCPFSEKSPLDRLLGRYIAGKETTVYVQGSHSPTPDTPRWLSDMMADITVPVPVPGHTFGDLIKNFTLADTHFSLPDPWAEPEDPASNPRISAKVRALVALPEEMNFNVSVHRVRADADIFYKGEKLGKLDMHEWQPATSYRIDPTESEKAALMVESVVNEAPIHITDENLFADVIQDLIFNGKSVVMHIKAQVDVAVNTALAELTVRKIPAEGQVPITPVTTPTRPSKPGQSSRPSVPGDFAALIKPQVNDLWIINTTRSSLTFKASVNLTNPTAYSASVPYIDLHLMKNGSLIGRATAIGLDLVRGKNSFLNITATYDPLTFGGEHGHDIGRDLISQYISGWNTSFTVQAHEASIPNQPALGRALARFAIQVPAPRLGLPDSPYKPPPDDDDDGGPTETPPRFLRDATMHLFSSTATFVLLSPLQHNTLFITSIDATAMYHDDVVGRIVYDEGVLLGVPPLAQTPDGQGYETPRLPVDWHLGSVGYDAVRRALGGTLKLQAKATVEVKFEQWEERIWFEGSGIGAKITI